MSIERGKMYQVMSLPEVASISIRNVPRELRTYTNNKVQKVTSLHERIDQSLLPIATQTALAAAIGQLDIINSTMKTMATEADKITAKIKKLRGPLSAPKLVSSK